VDVVEKREGRLIRWSRSSETVEKVGIGVSMRERRKTFVSISSDQVRMALGDRSIVEKI